MINWCLLSSILKTTGKDDCITRWDSEKLFITDSRLRNEFLRNMKRFDSERGCDKLDNDRRVVANLCKTSTVGVVAGPIVFDWFSNHHFPCGRYRKANILGIPVVRF